MSLTSKKVNSHQVLTGWDESLASYAHPQNNLNCRVFFSILNGESWDAKSNVKSCVFFARSICDFFGDHAVV